MASTYLSKTFGSAGNLTTWTLSYWIKRSSLSVSQAPFSSETDSNNSDLMYFQSSDKFDWWEYTDPSYKARKVTSQVFRDTSAWYNIVCTWDTSNATSTDRQRIYVNGERITSFSTNVEPALNEASRFNSTTPFNIGRSSTGSSGYFNGSMTHVHFIDGTAYDADTFGSTDATTGIWIPKTAPSVTYGTNGFFLKFENSASFGTDSSGNANTFTTNGTMTQTLDTPSNVFATLNPLNKFYATNTYSNGNLEIVAGGAWSGALSTLAVSQGKYYWEIKLTGTMTNHFIGVQAMNIDISPQNIMATTGTTYFYNNDGGLIKADDTAIGGTYGIFSSGDIAGMALDMDAGSYGQLTIYKNGTAIATGIDISSTTNGGILPFSATNGSTQEYNFGNGYFGTTAVASAENPDDGIGIFEYDVPAGYRALCTKSINAEEYS